MAESNRFASRTEAGERRGATLRERGVDADIVPAIPRGGLPLGRAVADALDVPLDVVVGDGDGVDRQSASPDARRRGCRSLRTGGTG